jgi:hypothetical protein
MAWPACEVQINYCLELKRAIPSSATVATCGTTGVFYVAAPLRAGRPWEISAFSIPPLETCHGAILDRISASKQKPGT